MNLVACCIRDVQVEAFMTPMFFQSVPQAIRSFQDAMRDSNHEFGKHPEDYVMYLVGEYEPETGLLVGRDSPVRLIGGSEVIRTGPQLETSA